MTHSLFVLGGTRSGKSRHARDRARALGGDRVSFIATAFSGDPELDARIALHQADRPTAWQTVEVTGDLATVIAGLPADNVVLLDSLTLWLSAVIEAPEPRRSWQRARDALSERKSPVIVVSDEIGLGIVPLQAETRFFRDELGWIHQDVAMWADEVVFMVAGIPLRVKGS